MARTFQRVALLLAAAMTATGCAATWEQVPHTRYDDISYYHDELAAYGTWVDVATYGTVWCPDGLSSSWQPYTVGYWVSADDGWFWVSEDPWGGVPYHYGRWAFDGDYGWVWVPGDVWAPAWVAWRYGSGWVGWAPLPPDISWQADVGIEHYGSDLDRYIDTRHWSFTEAQDFGTHRRRVRVEPSSDKNPLLKQTRNVTRYAAGPRPVEEGMRPDLIREIRGKKVERYRIADATKGVSRRGPEEIRERRAKPDPPAVERPERERQDRGTPESRVATPHVVRPKPPAEKERTRSEVALGQGRQPGVEVRARNEIKRQDKRADVEERRVAAQQEEVDETARRREEASRQREEAARQREEAARQREVDTQQREDASRKRERVQDGQRNPPNRDRNVGEPKERMPEKSTPPDELRERREDAPEGKGSSRGRARGR